MVLQLADNVYESTRPAQTVAAIQTQSQLDSCFHQDFPNQASFVICNMKSAFVTEGFKKFENIAS